MLRFCRVIGAARRTTDPPMYCAPGLTELPKEENQSGCVELMQ
jgi:hypothetical protein